VLPKGQTTPGRTIGRVFLLTVAHKERLIAPNQFIRYGGKQMSSRRSTNDRDSLQRSEVEVIVRHLSVSYSLLRRAFQQRYTTIIGLLESGDVTAVVGEMVQVFGLPKGFVTRVGYAAKIASPAEVQLAFKGFTDTLVSAEIYFKHTKAELASLSEHSVPLVMIAHEVAHIRLYLDRHPLRFSEFATDTLAHLVTSDITSIAQPKLIRWLDHGLTTTDSIGYVRLELRPELARHIERYGSTIYL
jgi:hypothetical protein